MKRGKRRTNNVFLSAAGRKNSFRTNREGEVPDTVLQPIDLSFRSTVRVEPSYFELLSREEQEKHVAERSWEITNASREAYDREVAARVLRPSSDLVEFFFRALKRKMGKRADVIARI